MPRTIERIELNGFKSFVADSIELGQLTILTGLNSSGKSSVMQGLLLLEKASKREKLLLKGHGNLTECKNPYSKELEIIGYFESGKIIRIQDGKIEDPENVFFPELIYIAADRFGPETIIPIYVDSQKLGSRGQNIFKCIDYYADFELQESLIHEKSEGVTFLFNLKAWLGVISPGINFIHHLEETSDSSFGTFNGHRAKNVGFGLSYGLPIITALLLGSIIPNSVVMIENPEAHLHPRGQTEIARLISLCVNVGVQVIVETHSDHLFDGIRVFTKQNAGFYEFVNIYWFELDKNNNTDVQEAKLDAEGRLDEWPSGLFDQFQINASKLL